MFELYKTSEGRVVLAQQLRERSLPGLRSRLHEWGMVLHDRPREIWPMVLPAYELRHHKGYSLNTLMVDDVVDPELFSDRLGWITDTIPEAIVKTLSAWPNRDWGSFFTYEVNLIPGLEDVQRVDFIVSTFWGRIRFVGAAEGLTRPTRGVRP